MRALFFVALAAVFWLAMDQVVHARARTLFRILFFSQLLGALGDVVGQHVTRVRCEGNKDQMLLWCTLVNVPVALGFAAMLPETIRYRMILTSPFLLVQNGILAVIFSVAEAHLFQASWGAVAKSLAQVTAPLILAPLLDAQLCDGWAFAVVGCLSILVPMLPAWSSKNAANDTPTPSLWLPAALLCACYAYWNVVPRLMVDRYQLNSTEWLFLDKVVGGAWMAVYIAITQRKQLLESTWSFDAWPTAILVSSVVFFLFFQYARLALSYMFAVNKLNNIAAAAFLTSITRTCLSILVSLACIICIPSVIRSSEEEQRYASSVKPLFFRLGGAGLILATIMQWAMQPYGAPVHVLVMGDMGRLNSTEFVVTGQHASVFAKLNPIALGIHLGDAFYPRGVNHTQDVLQLEMRVKQWLPQTPWVSVLGNHDVLNHRAHLLQQQSTILFLYDFHTISLPLSRTDPLHAEQHALLVFLHTLPIQSQALCNHNETCMDTMQRHWLKQMVQLDTFLTTHKQRYQWVLVFGHHPIFGTGKWAHYQDDESQRMATTLLPILLQHRVHLYFSGHDHLMQSLRYKDLHLFIQGASSSNELDTDPPETSPATVMNEIRGHNGYSVISFYPDQEQLCVRHYAVNHSFVHSCLQVRN